MTETNRDVAIFISSLEGGGAERVMRDLANAFVERGLATDLLLTRGKGPYLKGLAPQVRLINFDARKPLFALRSLVRYLKQHQPRALLSALDHTNLIAVASRRLARVPTRVVVSQRRNPSNRPSLRREPLEIFNHLLLGFGYRQADAVAAVSEGVARALEHVHSIPRDRIHVIYNSVEIPPLSQNEEVPHPWLKSVGGQTPVVLGVGRLTHVKGFDTLIRAFSIVRSDRPARLILLGEGNERASLSLLARCLGVDEDVGFPGFILDPWIWMQRASVLVLSSRSEGFPGVLLQAMACGTSVVSTNCEFGPDEILEGGRWGRLVPVDDHKALAKGILDTLDDQFPPRVIERARDFDPNVTIHRYLELLEVQEEPMPPSTDAHSNGH